MNEQCRTGQHPLEEILSKSNGYDSYAVAQWCPDCGAIVVDMESDGRIAPGYFTKMKLPECSRPKPTPAEVLSRQININTLCAHS